MPRPYTRPYGVRIPYRAAVADHDDAVDVIGHNRERIRRDLRKMVRDLCPAVLHDVAVRVQTHVAVHDVAEQTFVLVGADSDETGAACSVIVALEADGTAVVTMWVVCRVGSRLSGGVCGVSASNCSMPAIPNQSACTGGCISLVVVRI